MATDFRIGVASQGWLPPAPGYDYDPVAHDLCTHGEIELVIGGEVVAASGGEDGYGIGECALALLRTLAADHSRSEPVADRLVPHGCGTILMMSCPIGIDWTVTHEGGSVRLSDVVRYDGTGAADVVEFPGLGAVIPIERYREEIAAFARTAREPFDGIDKVFADEFDREQYASFWDEYERLLARAGS